MKKLQEKGEKGVHQHLGATPKPWQTGSLLGKKLVFRIFLLMINKKGGKARLERVECKCVVGGWCQNRY